VIDVADVMQERGEPHRPVCSCCLTYPLQRTGHAGPARCPVRVLLVRVPFGQAPFLHRLRGRRPSVLCAFAHGGVGFVRRLRGYYGPVRLPRAVRHRRTPFGFPTRPAALVSAGGSGISRFPNMVVPGVHGVCDRAGAERVSRWRRARCGLPLLLTASAPRRVLSRLNTRPVRSPVDASTPPSRAPPHDPGPAWIANPSPYETFIHTTMPV
jgi:hypothetical protein